MNYWFLAGFAISFGMLITTDVLISKKCNKEMK